VSKERPILFSTPMVRALLAGTKTQTRRIVKPQPVTSGDRDTFLCPYGQPGDLLWVRETHYVASAGYRDGRDRVIWYRATEPEAPCSWTPSIHMPRWASRITLRITGVRVERLNDISNEDAAAEGWPGPDEQNSIASAYPIAWYSRLWEQINGRSSWERNPWVWVVSFERVQPSTSEVQA
jgi:hypothetical protein